MKKNCWEFKECGRQPGGHRMHELGLCPASTESKLHGIHGGTNSGRACWVIAETLCSGEKQGLFGNKFYQCRSCDFYRLVQTEEHPRFVLSPILLKMINGK